MGKWLLAPLIILFVASSAFSQEIIVDGKYEDWVHIDPLFTDARESEGLNKIDFEHLYVTNDDNFLYLRFDLNKIIELQEDNRIALLIDTDNNLQTGQKINGMGVELRYDLGDRFGRAYLGGEERLVSHEDILLISSPTHSADEFELMISLNAIFDGEKLFNSDEIAIRIEDNDAQGDDMPDDLGGIEYTLVDFNRNYPSTLEKMDSGSIRLASFNVYFDRLFEVESTDAYRRILSATKPDIIALQEIYDHNVSEVKDRLEDLLPGTIWNVAGENNDIFVASKYEVEWLKSLSGNAAFKIDVDGQDLLLINIHPPCCNDDFGRQNEVDEIMAFVRDIMQRFPEYGFDEMPPYIIAGDTNFVGDYRQIRTILDGMIVNNGTFGPNFSPDLDGSSLEFAPAVTTGLPAEITWFVPGSFSGGKLDFIFYSDARIRIMHSYALLTYFMSQGDLDKYNLEAEDSALASDHGMVVADFDFHFSSTEHSPDIGLYKVYPNPAREVLTVETAHNCSFEVIDMHGRAVSSGMFTNGLNELNLTDFPLGSYILKIMKGSQFITKKFQVIKS